MLRRAGALVGIASFVVFMAACSHSDIGITTAVKTKLAADDTVKAYKIDVDTKEGVVTLTGNVETAEVKSHAVEVARNTKGVTSVVDQLSVAPPPVATSGIKEVLTDTAITTAVKAALLADPVSSGLKVHVDTSNAVVTLTGTISSDEEKTRAEDVAKATAGVSSVVNNLTVSPKKAKN